MDGVDSRADVGGSSGEKECVKVAVNVRPLVTCELLVGCTDCITVVPGEPQVQIGSHSFTYDYVFGNTGSPSSKIYAVCVAPLVEAIFSGYNATVLAYGQTGSGKTYTMGTNYTGENHIDGIIPKVMDTIFAKVEASKDTTEFLIRVSFIEIFKEEVFDLLDSNPSIPSRNEGTSLAKPSVPPKVPIQIRETVSGGITLAGVTEPEVRSKEEMAAFLARGALARATGSTNMNSQSSRSHAIFTISMEQKRISDTVKSGAANGEFEGDILCAKLHLVDLAGSERAKRTGADGLRLKEGIHINKGLLALGNVISALGDEKKRKEGGHIPYRDSKLTRLLQDSLGGNSKTVMIACVSPADTNAEETLNTLKYANRARNIQNKAVINRDPVAADMQRMRSQLEQLQAELLFYRGDGASFDELQILRHKISVLEASNAELCRELQERESACKHLSQSAVDAQVEKDKLVLKIEAAQCGKPWQDIDTGDEQQDIDLLKTYVTKIQNLEGQLHHMQSIKSSSQSGLMSTNLEDDGLQCEDVFSTNLNDEFDAEKEREHSSLQDQLDKELRELDKQLEQKEAEMKRVAKVDTSVLKQHYEKKLLDLEQEKKALQKEIEELRSNLSSISSSDDSAQKLKEGYLQKLNALEAQVAELKRKQEAQSQLLKQKQKSDEAAKRLHDEIHRIKSQKVQLQHKIKHESEQFRLWKASREKEVLQLRKEGRRNEYEMHKLLALNQRQKMVLQRKTEEASMASKRLKELLEAKKASSRESGAGYGNGLSIQALMQSIEHELEVMVRVHEVRSKYDRYMEERTAWAKEIAELKEEADAYKQKNMGGLSQTMSPGARNSRIFALENMLKTSSSIFVDMASQLSATAETERAYNGRGRWNQVRSLPEAKNLLHYLFNLVSSSRCQLRDAELASYEKDSVIKELKEKVVKVSRVVRQLETQALEMSQQEKLLKNRAKNSHGVSCLNSVEDGRPYDLRKSARISSFQGDDMDMDTSDSDQPEMTDTEWEESGYKFSRHKLGRKRARKSEAPRMVSLSPEQSNIASAKSASEVCCSCSKLSQCKTARCECRSVGNICGLSCGCTSSKCTNREAGSLKEDSQGLDVTVADSEESPVSDLAESVDSDRNKALVSHGAKLLQSALGDKPVDANEGDPHTRKPLADIGNTAAKSKQQNQRKKWGKKSVVQLIPAAPLPPSHHQDKKDAAQESSNETVRTDEILLKLPRAMTPMNMSSNPFRERNLNSIEVQSTAKKDSATTAKSPLRQKRVLKDKENNGI